MKYAAFGKTSLTAHGLRLSFGTYVYKKTKNIRGVQETLGHSNITTNLIYTHVLDHESRKLIDETFEK